MLAASAMTLITSTALSFAQGGGQAFHRVLSMCLSRTSNRSAEGFLLAVVSLFEPALISAVQHQTSEAGRSLNTGLAQPLQPGGKAGR